MKIIAWIALTSMTSWCDSLGDGCEPIYPSGDAGSSEASSTGAAAHTEVTTSGGTGDPPASTTGAITTETTGTFDPESSTTHGLETMTSTGSETTSATSTSTSTSGTSGSETTGSESETTGEPLPCEDGGWRVKSVIFAADGEHGDHFGVSLSVTEDGRLIVGAEGRAVLGNSFAGAVYEFTLDGAVWTPGVTTVSKSPGSGARFGHAVDLSEGRVIVGQPGVAPGVAYIYLNTWILEQTLAGQAADHSFGGAVAVEGGLAAIGTWLHAGARTYGYNGVGWSAEPTLMNGPNSRFGQSLDLRGNLLAIGDELTDTVSIFRREGNSWVSEGKVSVPEPLNVALALDNAPADLGFENDQLLFVTTMASQGKLHVFSRTVFVDMASWHEDAVLPVDGDLIADVGKSTVSVVGTHHIVAGVKAPWKGPGKAMFFDRKGQTWVAAGYLAAPGYEQSDFGVSVGMLAEDRFLVGAALEEDQQGGLPGAVYDLERCSP